METKFQEEFSNAVLEIRYPPLQLEIINYATIMHKWGVCMYVKRESEVCRGTGTVGANALLQHAVHFACIRCICVLSEEAFRDVHHMKPLPILYGEFLIHNSANVSKEKIK